MQEHQYSLFWHYPKKDDCGVHASPPSQQTQSLFCVCENSVSKLQIPIVNCKEAYRQPLHHLLMLHHWKFKPLNAGHELYKGWHAEGVAKGESFSQTHIGIVWKTGITEFLAEYKIFS